MQICFQKGKSCNHESGLKDHGKEIIEFCKMSGFTIANGRLGEGKGQRNGNSIVDYLLVREKVILIDWLENWE